LTYAKRPVIAALYTGVPVIKVFALEQECRLARVHVVVALPTRLSRRVNYSATAAVQRRGLSVLVEQKTGTIYTAFIHYGSEASAAMRSVV
jgi:hypothetical protein